MSWLPVAIAIIALNVFTAHYNDVNVKSVTDAPTQFIIK